MNACNKLSCILNVVSIVVAATIITNGTMFNTDVDSNGPKTCTIESRFEPVSAPSLISCVWDCSTRAGCQGVTYDVERQKCVACNGTDSEETRGNNTLTGAKLYEKSTPGLSVEVESEPACLTCWDSFENSSYLISNQSSDYFDSRTNCYYYYGADLVELDTARELDYLAQRLAWTNGSYWSGALARRGWDMDYVLTITWIWNETWDRYVPDEVWAPGVNTSQNGAGCMLPQYDYKLSVCDNMGKLQYVCEKKIM